MKQIKNPSSQQFLSCLFFSLSALLIPGFAGGSSISDASKDEKVGKKSGSSTWVEILIVILGLLAVGAFSVFLYKLWQRKKREEQHTRLLKLFEQDDELEVELGIRD